MAKISIKNKLLQFASLKSDPKRLQRTVQYEVEAQLESNLGYPSPVRVRIVFKEDNPTEIEDVVLTTKYGYQPPGDHNYRLNTQAEMLSYLFKDMSSALKQVEMTATYVGEDGSLGFRRGQVYRITLTKNGSRCYVRSEEGNLYCPYATIYAFCRYWIVEDLYQSSSDNHPSIDSKLRHAFFHPHKIHLGKKGGD